MRADAHHHPSRHRAAVTEDFATPLGGPRHPDRLTPAKHRVLIGAGLLRALVTTVVLVTLYYLLPLDHVTHASETLPPGVLILVGAILWQLRAIGRARHPAVRAIQALAATLPLFLLLFASAYYVMARTNPASFSAHPLTRTDTLYFTVTVFSTVGFGDISPVTQSARLVVTGQMLLDLLALGLVVRAFIGAVQQAKQSADPGDGPEGTPGQARQQEGGTR